MSIAMETLADLVHAARAGDVAAFGRLVAETQTMVFAVTLGVLRDRAAAQDATQQVYLRAFRRLDDLQDPAAVAGWLRRIAVTVALNARRARRVTFLRLDDVPEVPVLDEGETRWSDAQRQRLAAALVTLPPGDRQVCDRRYHGGWSISRLAADAGVDAAAMRKRLQRIRDRLRREIEMTEQHGLSAEDAGRELPARIIELLASPHLTELPENPVGRVLRDLRAQFPECDDVVVPEVVDLAEASRSVAADAIYVGADELHRIDERRILRYDLTLPLLLSLRSDGRPLRAFASGKAYRVCRADALHLEAFHQAEVFWLDDRTSLDPWAVTGRVLQAVDHVLPGRAVKIVPTAYPMCRQAWELAVDDDGEFREVLAWGVFTDRIVSHLGADPARQVAIGMGCGLERLAMLRYRIDDIRKIEAARVA